MLLPASPALKQAKSQLTVIQNTAKIRLYSILLPTDLRTPPVSKFMAPNPTKTRENPDTDSPRRGQSGGRAKEKLEISNTVFDKLPGWSNGV